MSSSTSAQSLGGTIAVPRNKNQKIKHAVVLTGAANAGKGLVTEQILEHFQSRNDVGKIKHYSSSRALGDFAKTQNRKDVLEQMGSGYLVDFEVVRLVSSWDYNDFVHHGEIAIFDGWWRVPQEIEVARQFFNRHDISLRVIALDGEKEPLWERAKNRGREDAQRVVYENRFAVHQEYFPKVVKAAQKFVGAGNVSVLDTTHMKKAQVREHILSCLTFV